MPITHHIAVLRLEAPAPPSSLYQEPGLGPLGIGLLCACLAAAAFTLFKYYKNKKSSPLTPLQLAYADAQNALNSISAESLSQTATQVSLILRTFLARSSQDPSLYFTQKEFEESSEALKSLAEQGRKETSDFLTTLTNHKYGNNKTSSESCSQILEQGESILRKLYHSHTQLEEITK